MLREATWRSWAVPVVLIAASIVIGLTWSAGGSAQEWIFKIGILGATFVPLLVIAFYTALGKKWWQNDLGTSLVQALLYITIFAAPLAWAAWLNRGEITTGLVAWMEIIAPSLVAIGVGRFFWVVARISRESDTS